MDRIPILRSDRQRFHPMGADPQQQPARSSTAAGFNKEMMRSTRFLTATVAAISEGPPSRDEAVHRNDDDNKAEKEEGELFDDHRRTWSEHCPLMNTSGDQGPECLSS